MNEQTDQENQSEKLSELSSKAISLFDSTDNAVIIADKEQNFIFVNTTAKQMFGDPPMFLLSQDKLTGLANRDFFLRHLDNAVKLGQQQPNHNFAVLFLDLARFKVINDSLGYKVGDKLLIAVSEKLKECLRNHDVIARLGNDDFAILLNKIKDVNCAVTIAERIGNALMMPFDIDGNEVFVNVHIGIATNATGYEEPEKILRNASTAIAHYSNIRQNQAGYQIFNEQMHSQTVEILRLENDLRKAIDRQQFRLHYQPIVCLKTQRIIGFETLVRWQHPERGLLSPAEFIPLAEETGLIVDLGAWVLSESCRQLYSWQQQFPEAAKWVISVNISGQQLLQPGFLQEVTQTLLQTKLNPSSLKLELTESVLLENNDILISVFEQLNDLGITFSLDDFGTGYSSLSYLHQFPVFHTLKIDRSFIRSLDEGNDKLAVVRAILALANSLGMDVVAEGIEENHQLAQLNVLECQYGQGYLFSKPLDSKATESLIITELARFESLQIKDPKLLLQEKLSQENFLLKIEKLSQELEQLKQEKADLEIVFRTTQQHASLIEEELQQEIDNHEKVRAKLEEVNRKLESLSLIDGLTQVANRRHFDEYLQQQWQKSLELGEPISLILADVDYFKAYNDHYGHQGGDKCLQQIAKALTRPVRSPADLVARYGGEEFVIILPHTDAEAAIRVAERIRSELREMKIHHEKSQVSNYVTISLGVANVIPSKDKSPESLIALADQALYEAKAQGRDRFILDQKHD